MCLREGQTEIEVTNLSKSPAETTVCDREEREVG